MIRRYGIGAILLGIGLLVFLVLGAIALGLSAGAIQRTTWPTTDGVVTGSDTRTRTTGYSSSNGRSTSTTIYPQVAFEVDGKRYSFTSSIGGKAIPRGTHVTVQYHQDDPAHAEIEGRASWVPYFLGAMGAGFLIIFGLPGFIAIRYRLYKQAGSPQTGFWLQRIWPRLRRLGWPAQAMLGLAVLAFLPLGILCVVTAVADSHRADWPTAEGSVVQMLETRSYDDPDEANRPNARYTTVYSPVIRYAVGGHSYTVISNHSSAKPTAAVGDPVTVHYDPDDPAHGVLDAGRSFVPYLLGGLGVGLLLALGIPGVVLAKKRIGVRPEH